MEEGGESPPGSDNDVATIQPICCPVCEEPYATDEPRTPCLLPTCFHTFCRQCLFGIAERAPAGGTFECPTCREPCANGVAELRLNFALMDAIEAQSILCGAKKLLCQDCDENLEAENQCMDCNVLLCSTCFVYHKRSNRTKAHTTMTIAEMKELGKAAPKPRAMCTKHKQKELRLYCKSCKMLICDDCPIKDHKDHEYDLLTEVTEEHKTKLMEEAELVDAPIATLQEAISALKDADKALEYCTSQTRKQIRQHYEQLAAAVKRRGEEVETQLDAVWMQKHKVLEGQWTGLELAVASMSSGAEHARKTAASGDDQEVMATYGQIAAGLQRLRERTFKLTPDTSSKMFFIGISDMLDQMAKHGSVSTVTGFACTAEGQGLTVAKPDHLNSFAVQVRSDDGSIIAEPAEIEVRECEGQDQDQGKLAETKVTEEAAGRYVVAYKVEGKGKLKLQVMAKGAEICNSPFTIPLGVELKMESAFDTNGVFHYIGTAGGSRALLNPHDSGDVCVTLSSLQSGNPGCLVLGNPQYHGTYLFTQSQPQSWMAVDLKSFRLSPRFYCLRASSNGYAPTYWRLEGSHDGTTWTSLREHNNDQQLCAGPGITVSWTIEGREGESFRHFRILQTNVNCHRTHFLACGGLELYGLLFESQDDA